MKKSNFSKVTVLAVLLVLMCSVAAAAANPMGVVRWSNTKALSLQRNRQGKLDPATEKALMKVINSVTSFSTMSKNVMQWLPSSLTASEKSRFDSVFIKLLRVSSVKKAGRYRAKGFRYLGMFYRGGAAVVKTQALYKSDTVALNYTLRRIGGAWKIVDYEIDGIGTVDNYRKMFRILFRRKNMNSVISLLKRKIRRYEQDK